MATIKSLLKNKFLLTLGISESVSNTGNWITMMAVFAMLVFRNNGGVVESSGVFLAGLIPTLVFSPVAGWLLDRFDRRALMIISELVSGLVISGLIFVQDLFWIYALIALQAISISIMSPARQAVLPDIIGHDQLTQANAFMQQLAGIIKMSAPMIAGAVLAVLNPHLAIILDVISFAFSALILSRLPTLPPHHKAVIQKPDFIKPQPQQGNVFGALGQLPALRLMFISAFFAITLIVGLDVLSPVYTRDVLHGDESFFGLIIGLIGLGTLIASLWLMRSTHQRNIWRDVLLGLLLLAVIPTSMALGTHLQNEILARAVVIVGALIGGIGNGLINIQSGTLLQVLSPSDLLGRMSGVFQSTAVSGQLVGIVITPVLVPSLLPVGLYFAIAALLLVGLVAFMSRQDVGNSVTVIEDVHSGKMRTSSTD